MDVSGDLLITCGMVHRSDGSMLHDMFVKVRAISQMFMSFVTLVPGAMMLYDATRATGLLLMSSSLVLLRRSQYTGRFM